MQNQKDLVALGSKTAKDGFVNENDAVNRFNDWHTDLVAQEWLQAMGYVIEEIDYVKALKIKGSFKADIQISVEIKCKNLVDIQNIQVKLVSNKSGFNQVDKRWLDKYQELWDIPNELLTILKHFTGELNPYRSNTRESRRMFLDELSDLEQQLVLDFFNKNKTLVICDLLKGRGKYSAEWVLVILKMQGQYSWVIKPINYVLNFYSEGEVFITNRGSLKIGKITMQRKGGDGGRPTANMLQFKINPCLLFDLNVNS
jgi:hypothetical protein